MNPRCVNVWLLPAVARTQRLWGQCHYRPPIRSFSRAYVVRRTVSAAALLACYVVSVFLLSSPVDSNGTVFVLQVVTGFMHNGIRLICLYMMLQHIGRTFWQYFLVVCHLSFSRQAWYSMPESPRDVEIVQWYLF